MTIFSQYLFFEKNFKKSKKFNISDKTQAFFEKLTTIRKLFKTEIFLNYTFSQIDILLSLIN